MGYQQSGGAFSPLESPGTYVLLEDFRSRSWADSGGGGSPVFKQWNTGLLNLTDDSDLPSSGIFQAGCRRRRGWKVRTAHVTQLHFRVPKRSAAGINTTTRLFSSHGPDKNPEALRHTTEIVGLKKKKGRLPFIRAPTTLSEITSHGLHVLQASPNSS